MMRWSSRRMALVLDHPVPWSAALFALLAVAATYPIARSPARLAFFGHSDALLNMWIMAWDAHALRHDPLNLFNANIFHPLKDTLAYSETLLGYLPIFGPILWLGGSPALAFNVVLLFSFAASGFAMFLLARHLTGRQWPAVAAGIVYAFTPYRFAHIPQIQLEAMEWMPLAFLSLHLFVERGHLRYAAGLGASVVLGTLCCVYYGVFLTAAMVVAVVILLIVDRRVREARTLLTLLLVGALVAGVLAPLMGEYLRVHRRSALERSIDEIADRSADWNSYLSSGAPAHLALGLVPPDSTHDYLFPGFFLLLLAGTGVVLWTRRRLSAVYIAVSLVGWALSLGPGGLFGRWLFLPLYEGLPVLHGLRQISRFGVVVLFGLSVLSAFGAATLDRRFARHRFWLLIIPPLAFLEVFPAPLRLDRPGGVALMRVPDTPAEYRWLTEQPGAFTILELPLPHPGLVWRNAPYVYWSTTHWHPLVNGYSGFVPSDYWTARQMLGEFPDGLSEAALRARRVRYVVIHWGRFEANDQRINEDRLRRAAWLRPVTQFSDAEIFEVQGAGIR